MTKFVAITSGKGGVGKTICTINLAYILNSIGRRTIIVDANFTTPNISLYLGSPTVPVTLHDVIEGKKHIRDALYIHPSGIKVIPSNISLRSIKNVDSSRLNAALLDLAGMADYVLIDSPPGINQHLKPVLENADETLIVTQPELAAVTDALKTAKLASRLNSTVIGAVINRKGFHKNEMEIENVQTLLDMPILGIIPEDKNIMYSLLVKHPLTYIKPESLASLSFKELAFKVTGEAFREIVTEKKPFGESLLKTIGLKK